MSKTDVEAFFDDNNVVIDDLLFRKAIFHQRVEPGTARTLTWCYLLDIRYTNKKNYSHHNRGRIVPP